MLQDEGKKEEYAERTRQLLEEGEGDESLGEWERVSKVMVRAAKEVCGESERGVANPWVIGHEEEIDEMMARVNAAVDERNECVTALNARRRLRTRVRRNAGLREDVWMMALAVRVTRAKAKVREARKEVRRFTRRLERRWWQERIEECREACDRGRIGDMYKCLQKIGSKGRKAPESSRITVGVFKEHFERVSKDRYEEEPSVIARVVGRVEDLREDERAKSANEKLNAVPEREEIERALKEMKDSSPREDGVRLR